MTSHSPEMLVREWDSKMESNVVLDKSLVQTKEIADITVVRPGQLKSISAKANSESKPLIVFTVPIRARRRIFCILKTPN